MNTDDPKLTAYALEELAPSERAEIEALLKDEPVLAIEIDATRGIAARLWRELHAEEGAPLSPTQRETVLAMANECASPGKVAPMRIWPRRLLKIAAGLVVLGAVAGMLFPFVSAMQENAQRRFAPASPESRGLVEGRATPAEAPIADPRAAAKGMEIAGRSALRNDDDSLDTNVTTAGLPVANAGVLSPTEPASETLAPLKIGTVDMKKLFDSYAMTKEADPKVVVEEINKLVEAKVKAEGYDVVFDKSRPSLNGVPAPLVSRDAREFTNDVIAALNKNPGSLPASTGVGHGATTNNASGTLTLSGAISYPSATTLAGGTLAMGDTSGLRIGGGGTRTEPDLVLNRFGNSGEFRFQEHNGDTASYDAITDNAFLAVKDNPLSTFSIDVDTASYANVRRFLNSGRLPPKGAVRVEEMLNYFSYDYPQPAGDAPFSATMEVAACPWAPEHRLVRIGLKGRDLARSERPAVNLVFLIDVSGSMSAPNRLPLVKESLRLLVDQLRDEDRVAIAVYAGASGTVLEPTRDKTRMRRALDRLQAGGSTNGAAGIQLAYQLAEQSLIKGGTNRVILATDGDFNVGVTSQSELIDLIEKKARSGVSLTVLGFGMDNLKDSTLEKLADKGNGNYGYIDTLLEAKKMLVEQMNGTLFTIAKDVKIQVEFNPAQAAAYRLIGYENRLMAKEDFNDDKKDAGEIGAGHTVTALYEIVPAGASAPGATPTVDELKYRPVPTRETASRKSSDPAELAVRSGELLTLKLRYKQPESDVSAKLEFPLTDRGGTWEKSSRDFRWAAAVASFGMLLRDSPHKGRATWDSALELAHEGKAEDDTGYRAECLALLEKARALK